MTADSIDFNGTPNDVIYIYRVLFSSVTSFSDDNHLFRINWTSKGARGGGRGGGDFFKFELKWSLIRQKSFGSYFKGVKGMDKMASDRARLR